MGLTINDSSTLGKPVCEHNDRFVRESRARVDGLIRRRWECCDCGERWTVLGPDCKKPRQRRTPGKPNPRLSLEQVHRALTDRSTSDIKLAAELGVSRQAVQQIRSGKTWTTVFPELPRRSQWRNCAQCQHWKGSECGFGFADPLEEGLSFAVDCDLYEM